MPLHDEVATFSARFKGTRPTLRCPLPDNHQVGAGRALTAVAANLGVVWFVGVASLGSVGAYIRLQGMLDSSSARSLLPLRLRKRNRWSSIGEEWVRSLSRRCVAARDNVAFQSAKIFASDGRSDSRGIWSRSLTRMGHEPVDTGPCWVVVRPARVFHTPWAPKMSPLRSQPRNIYKRPTREVQRKNQFYPSTCFGLIDRLNRRLTGERSLLLSARHRPTVQLGSTDPSCSGNGRWAITRHGLTGRMTLRRSYHPPDILQRPGGTKRSASWRRYRPLAG